MLVVLDRVRRHAHVGAVSAEAETSRLAEALAAGSDEARVARLLARLAAEALGAERAVLYRGDGRRPGADRRLRVPPRRDRAAPGRALAADAIARGEVLVTGGESGEVSTLATGGPGAVLSAPLMYEDELVGALQLHFSERDAARSARPAATKLAPAAAEALHRAGEARRRDDELRRNLALVQIAAQATASASIEQTLAAVGEHLATLAPGAQAGVYVIEEGRPVLSEPPAAVAAVQGAAVAALLREDPSAPFVLVADVTRDERLEGVAGEIAEAGVRSLLVVPLRFREAVIGALSLAGREPGTLGEREVDLMRRQAAPIALALESAVLASHSLRLEQELSAALAAERSARGELDAQDTVVRAVAENWDRPRASAAVARAAAELVDADAAGVLLLGADGSLVVESLHVASPALGEPVRRIVRHAPVVRAARHARLAGVGPGRDHRGRPARRGGDAARPAARPGRQRRPGAAAAGAGAVGDPRRRLARPGPADRRRAAAPRRAVRAAGRARDPLRHAGWPTGCGPSPATLGRMRRSLLAMAALALTLTAFSPVAQAADPEPVAVAGVTIGGVDVAGMTSAQAATAVTTAYTSGLVRDPRRQEELPAGREAPQRPAR